MVGPVLLMPERVARLDKLRDDLAHGDILLLGLGDNEVGNLPTEQDPEDGTGGCRESWHHRTAPAHPGPDIGQEDEGADHDEASGKTIQPLEVTLLIVGHGTDVALRARRYLTGHVYPPNRPSRHDPSPD